MTGRNFNGVQINQSVTVVEKAGADMEDCRNRATYSLSMERLSCSRPKAVRQAANCPTASPPLTIKSNAMATFAT